MIVDPTLTDAVSTPDPTEGGGPAPIGGLVATHAIQSLLNPSRPGWPAATELERELKHLIVEALMLEDVVPDAIATEAPLFGEGLGLDSIDALELAVAIERRFGVKVKPGNEQAPEIFSSVQTLAQYVAANRATPG